MGGAVGNLFMYVEAAPGAVPPLPFMPLLVHHLRHPRQEAALRAAFLGAGDDEDGGGDGASDAASAPRSASRDVRRMYETSPYPRWQAAFECVPGTRVCAYPPHGTAGYAAQLGQFLPGSAAAERWSVAAPRRQPLRVLFAGCGTGRQVLLTAAVLAAEHHRSAAAAAPSSRPTVEIVAVDLSAASLAYAQRQLDAILAGRGVDDADGVYGPLRAAVASGAVTVRFLRRDLLTMSTGDADLASAASPARGDFDIVECTGVLHHLSDPDAGLAVLRRLLTPRTGALRIALYSTAAREHSGVYAARAHLAAAGIHQPAADAPAAEVAATVRAARQHILATVAAPAPTAGAAADVARRLARLTHGDFHSVGDTRDLLFHVQEQAYDVPSVAATLERHALRFVGFDLSPALAAERREFAAAAGARGAAGEPWWAAWRRLEAARPAFFAGMFQLWAVPAGERE
jgi:SAM-dependent methyltransferase